MSQKLPPTTSDTAALVTVAQTLRQEILRRRLPPFLGICIGVPIAITLVGLGIGSEALNGYGQLACFAVAGLMLMFLGTLRGLVLLQSLGALALKAQNPPLLWCNESAFCGLFFAGGIYVEADDSYLGYLGDKGAPVRFDATSRTLVARCVQPQPMVGMSVDITRMPAREISVQLPPSVSPAALLARVCDGGNGRL